MVAKDGARDAGFLSPPTTTSLTTRVDTHVAGENESRSRIETLFIENRNSSKHPPIDMTRLSYPFSAEATYLHLLHGSAGSFFDPTWPLNAPSQKQDCNFYTMMPTEHISLQQCCWAVLP